MYYILIRQDDAAPDTYKVLTIAAKEDAFRVWQSHPGSTVVKDVTFKIVEEK